MSLCARSGLVSLVCFGCSPLANICVLAPRRGVKRSAEHISIAEARPKAKPVAAPVAEARPKAKPVKAPPFVPTPASSYFAGVFPEGIPPVPRHGCPSVSTETLLAWYNESCAAVVEVAGLQAAYSNAVASRNAGIEVRKALVAAQDAAVVALEDAVAVAARRLKNGNARKESAVLSYCGLVEEVVAANIPGGSEAARAEVVDKGKGKAVADAELLSSDEEDDVFEVQDAEGEEGAAEGPSRDMDLS